MEVGEVLRVVDLEGRSVKSHDSVGILSDFSGLPRGLCLWKAITLLVVGKVSKVVDLERRSVKSQDSVGIWSDLSRLPRGLCLLRARKGGWMS